MGLKILAVAAGLLGISMVGVAIPAVVVGILLIVGAVGVLAGF